MCFVAAGKELVDVEVTDFLVVPGEGVEARVSVSGEAPQLARMGNVKFVVRDQTTFMNFEIIKSEGCSYSM